MTSSLPNAIRTATLFDSLQSAAKLMVKQDGFDIAEINLERLAATYGTTPEKALEVIQIAQNGTRKLPEEVAASAPPAMTTEEVEE